MVLGSALQALIGVARVALAVIALVCVPLADAVACSADETPASDVMIVAADQLAAPATDTGHDKGGSPDAAHCIHGHCHSSVAFNQSVADDVLQIESRIDAPARDASIALPGVATGLERPPKA